MIIMLVRQLFRSQCDNKGVLDVPSCRLCRIRTGCVTFLVPVWVLETAGYGTFMQYGIVKILQMWKRLKINFALSVAVVKR